MNIIDQQLKKLKSTGKTKTGLMTHIVIGYPSFSLTKQIAMALIEAGSDFLELQIPFSDPLADGPIIMQACHTALKNGIRVKQAFKLTEYLRQRVTIPLLFMAYYNTIFRYGVKQFCSDAQNSGVTGLIIPDIPPEEEKFENFIEICLKNHLYPIRVVSPASSGERLKINAEVAKGFVYCISKFGTTGKQGKIAPSLLKYLKDVRHYTKLPLALGFGIYQPRQVKKLKDKADIIVVGSGIISLINKTGAADKLATKIFHYICRLKDSL